MKCLLYTIHKGDNKVQVLKITNLDAQTAMEGDNYMSVSAVIKFPQGAGSPGE